MESMSISQNYVRGGFACIIEKSEIGRTQMFKVVPLCDVEKVFPRGVSVCGTKAGVVSIDVS